MFHLQNNIYHGVCWIPINKELIVRDSLDTMQCIKPNMARGQLHRAEISEEDTPPTFITTNEFTSVFQVNKEII